MEIILGLWETVRVNYTRLSGDIIPAYKTRFKRNIHNENQVGYNLTKNN